MAPSRAACFSRQRASRHASRGTSARLPAATSSGCRRTVESTACCAGARSLPSDWSSCTSTPARWTSSPAIGARTGRTSSATRSRALSTLLLRTCSPPRLECLHANLPCKWFLVSTISLQPAAPADDILTTTVGDRASAGAGCPRGNRRCSGSGSAWRSSTHASTSGSSSTSTLSRASAARISATS